LVEGECAESDFKHNIIYDNDKRVDGYKDDDLRIFSMHQKYQKFGLFFSLQLNSNHSEISYFISMHDSPSYKNQSNMA